jgi:putative SOS response-associated peptidase YedK
MCGRFALKTSAKELQRYYHTKNAMEYHARYNIAPSLPVLTIHNAPDKIRIMDIMRWGLVPSWAKDISIGNRMINARSETLEEKPSFRNAFKRRRCIIPASGFYEWHAKTRDPYYFSSAEGVLSLAGIWEHWQSADGSELYSCAILTTSANRLLQPVHERMPVILKPDGIDLWLSPAEDTKLLKPLLQPYDDNMLRAWPISKQVNNPSNDTSKLVEPA